MRNGYDSIIKKTFVNQTRKKFKAATTIVCEKKELSHNEIFRRDVCLGRCPIVWNNTEFGHYISWQKPLISTYVYLLKNIVYILHLFTKSASNFVSEKGLRWPAPTPKFQQILIATYLQLNVLLQCILPLVFGNVFELEMYKQTVPYANKLLQNFTVYK